MKIWMKLALGFGAVVLMLAASGGVTQFNLRQLRATDEQLRERVALNELALRYRHATLVATLGAAQLAAGNVLGEQRVREAMLAMAESGKQLRARKLGAAQRRDVAELGRVEALTSAAVARVSAAVKAKQPAQTVQQELAFLAARSDALSLGLEALVDESREDVARSLARAATNGERVQQVAGYTLALCVLLAALVSAWALRGTARPIGRLDAGVQRLAGGDLTHPLEVTSSDEVGKISQAVNELATNLHNTKGQLDGRNRDLRVVLDHMHQGLLTMRRDGTTAVERSARVATWLGTINPELPLWQAMRNSAPAFAEALRTGFDAMLKDALPLELGRYKLPRSVTLKGRQLEFDYQSIVENEQLDKLLIVITDVSDRVAREAAIAHEREVAAVFRAMLRDKQGFLEFVNEGTSLVSLVSAKEAASNLAAVKRHLHTLHANSSAFELQNIASLCQELQTLLAAGNLQACTPLWPSLAKRWAALGEVIAGLTGDARSRIELDDDDYSAILEAILRGTPRSEIAVMVANWRMERADSRLLRLGDQARALAARHGKGELQVHVETGGIRLPRENFAGFWSALVHAIRNAVEHGIEGDEARTASGKQAPPTLTLATRVVGEELSIEVADNGRGIDWTQVAEKARQLGMPADSEDDLVAALFSDGVSTADSLAEAPARGIGMAALRAACAQLAGRITIDSELGRGTVMSFRFPLQAMRDSAVVEVSSRIPSQSLAPQGPDQPARASLADAD
jgi:HAMP domain-containing protein/HPt (histidine-containing phosphotransfer) domain-containing protein